MAFQILLAESDQTMIRALRPSLEAAGFQVIQATDGDAAWECIQTQSPSLVLLEANLPGLSSLDLLCRMRTHRQTANLPVILLGDPVTTENVVHWYRDGIDGYIGDPFSANVLLAQIRSLLRRVYG